MFQKNIIIGEIYKPPNYPNNNFLEYAEKLLDILENDKKLSLLAGDFNYNLLNIVSDKTAHTFLNLLSSYGFHPTIWKATRVTVNNHN